jgi:hypothetical protein
VICTQNNERKRKLSSIHDKRNVVGLVLGGGPSDYE